MSVDVCTVQDQSEMCPACGEEIAVGATIIFGHPDALNDEGLCADCFHEPEDVGLEDMGDGAKDVRFAGWMLP